VIIYNSVSFKLGKDDAARAAVINVWPARRCSSARGHLLFGKRVRRYRMCCG
jgi:hypothetical protein